MHDSEVDCSEEVLAFSREKNRACHQARIFSLHPASVFQHARKLTDRPYASTLVRAAKGGDDGVRGWQRDARGRGTVAGGRAECSRITNLILQMDPKTWKQWNI